MLNKLIEALPTVEWIYFVLAIITFLSLFFITAPYGRHNRGGWGLQINATLGWILMETVALVALPLLVVISGKPLNAVSTVFLAMWCGHYLVSIFCLPAATPALQPEHALVGGGPGRFSQPAECLCQWY